MRGGGSIQMQVAQRSAGVGFGQAQNRRPVPAPACFACRTTQASRCPWQRGGGVSSGGVLVRTDRTVVVRDISPRSQPDRTGPLAQSPMDESELVEQARGALDGVLSAWQSAFRATVTVQAVRTPAVHFNVAFSRGAHSNGNLPGTLVNVLFVVEMTAETPSISFQIEGEQYLYRIPENHRAARNIDQLLVTNLEFKQRLRDAFTPQIVGAEHQAQIPHPPKQPR